ncbi:BTB/POZ and MATH domain-containing protein 6-like [Miscanthus floridulus]|uniref:BTB/POZ and MATH domain-containing protein 6-like n=1 Tax=Miscanthus floridulus TaxID=154761 RepID=UPI003457C238
MPTQTSASVYRPSEVWRGRHQFTVLGHSDVRKTHGNGEFIRSGAFKVGGYEWQILCYPSGYDDEHNGHETVLLQLQVAMTPMDPNVVLEASGSIAIGDGSSSVSESESENDFCCMADFCHKYTNDEPAEGCRNLTISCLVGPDDSLTEVCSFEFQVVASKMTMTAARARLLALEQDMVVPPPSISWHLERLLETGVGSDVTFSVEDGEF